MSRKTTPKLRTLSDADGARIYAELGYFAYCRLWRQEMREDPGDTNDAESEGRAPRANGEALR